MGLLSWFTGGSKTAKKELMVENAKAFMAGVQASKSLPTTSTSFFLTQGEKAVFEESSALVEPQSVRQSGGSGIGFRVAKGVYVGGYSGQSRSHKEWALIDTGKVTLTNKRIVFMGTKQNRDIPLDKILSIACESEAIVVSIAGKDKQYAFKVANPLVWSASVNIIRNTANPFDLGDDKFNVDFGIATQ